MKKSKLIRVIYIFLGFTSVTLGVIGIFLPVMPTTVFLLLASFFFARSSEKFNNWLHNNKLLGNYLKNYNEGRGMTAGAKIFSTAFLWSGILLSVFFMENIYVRFFLIALALAISIHILCIKTYRPESN